MLTFGFWEPVIVIAAINVILICGLYITALSGALSMATAAFAGVGGYVAAVLTTNLDWPFIPALVVTTVVGAIVGCIVALVTLKMKDFVLKIATLAVGEALSIAAFNIKYVGGANGFSGIPLYTTMTWVLGVAALSIFVAWRVDKSRIGLGARAIRDDMVAAASTGISLRTVRLVTFGIGSALIALGGGLLAHYVLIISPSQLGFLYSLNYIVFLLAGGIQTLWGPVLTAILLSGIPELLRFANEYRLIAYGVIIVAVVMWRPEGLITRSRRSAKGEAAAKPNQTAAA
ncbi:MAG: branched-chain amino acid ABC transporter permease, partial [Rhizobiales bacterium]|nr:branched-chain amino acid ABC transporter permease [Hyphomicrobiales bacterium]